MNNKRIVLVALSGMSPAVITETVWALANQKSPVIPDEIVVLTTQKGKDLLNERIRMSKDGRPSIWEQMKSDLKKAKKPIDGKLCFGETSIHVFPDAEGNPLEDVTSIGDNERIADFMLSELRRYTALPDDECKVLVSIAGGRKTMSALMFSCMTLIGREDDKIYHVLVNPPYDTPMDPPFYYPQKGVRHHANGKSYLSVRAEIALFEVPYVRMLGWYQESFNKRKMPSYRMLIASMQKKTPVPTIFPKITVNLKDKSIVASNYEPLKTSAQEFVVFVLLAFWRDRSEIAGRAHRFFHIAKDVSRSFQTDTWLQKFVEPFGNEITARFEKEGNIRENFTKVCSSLRRKLSEYPPLSKYVEFLVPRTKGNFSYPEQYLEVKGCTGEHAKILRFLVQKKES